MPLPESPSSSTIGTDDSVIAVILAAGVGKRFKSDQPKVLSLFRGRPLVHWVIDTARQAGIGRIILVIGHLGEMIQAACSESQVEFAWQHERLGTGHALLQTEPMLKDIKGDVLVLLGDAPCIERRTILELIAVHRSSKAAATVLTAEVPDPSGYGRIVRRPDGTLDRIAEHRDADESTRRIREISSGMICFQTPLIFPVLDRLTNRNKQGEYYLTDAIGLLRADQHVVIAHQAKDWREVLGVNSPEELAALEKGDTG